MSRFLSLVQNENMKIYRRPRTWIMAIIMVLILALVVTINWWTESKYEKVDSDWKVNVQSKITNLETSLKNTQGMPDYYVKMQEDELKVNQYALENDVNILQKTMWDTGKLSANLIMIITIFTIIIAADIVAGEFSWGTIKLLLIRPASRAKILLSKYAATLLYSLFMLLILLVAGLILGLIFNGGGFSTPELYVGSDGNVHERSQIFSVLTDYGYNVISLIMMSTFAFMISAVFRSNSMAIGISIGLLLGSTLVLQIMVALGYKWVKYVLFTNMDLSQYREGSTPLVEGMTMGFSVTMLILYFIVFNVLSWALFTKRDVGA